MLRQVNQSMEGVTYESLIIDNFGQLIRFDYAYSI